MWSWPLRQVASFARFTALVYWGYMRGWDIFANKLSALVWSRIIKIVIKILIIIIFKSNNNINKNNNNNNKNNN